ncbi:MAG TPA: hypothetical protein VHR72_13870 [Gemmataceae bacterium]|jgi:hypothetical protein|nr:hypothetical protein [Gemmataceae bacterium]
MVQGYFTLKEAAEATGLSEDDLKGRAQRKEIRSFQDRGTLRFRIQDVQELQRQLMGGSDVDFQTVVPEAPVEAPRSGRLGGPKSGPKTPPSGPKSGKLPPASSEEVLDFELDDSIDIGREPIDLHGSSARSKSRLSGAGPKSGAAPKTPKRFSTGSDSDVKLVPDVTAPREPNTSDSDVRLDDLGPSTGGSSKRLSNSGRLKGKHGPSPADSGVRLVPMGEESPASPDDATLTDQPIAFAGEGAGHHEPPTSRASENILHTEEIDLDAEALKRDAAGKKPKSGKNMHAAPKTPRTPKPSPFELSDDGETHGSERKHTDFELPPPAGDEDFSLELTDDSLDLGAEPRPSGAPASGINLSRPTDAGVSLESDDEGSSDFELTLDDAPSHKTPKPSRTKPPTSPDESDFELTLDYSDEGVAPKADEGSGEFELSLDDGSPAAAEEGSSEFELTLDDGGAAAKEDSSGERDIFETDFELPSLEEGAEEATIDAGSSDFELALDDSDIATEDESGSQVIALDEGEYADDGEQTVTGDYGDVEEELDEEGAPVREKVVVEEVIRDRWIRPAPWGILPTIFMLPCTVVMILIGIMTFEMVASGSGYHSSGVLTKAIAAQILPNGAKTR